MKSQEELENISKINDLHEFDISEDSREIYLQGEIDEKALIKFIKNMNYLNFLSDEPICIHACSPGGDIACGFAMYSLIKQSKSPTIFIGHGLLASMTTVVIQAANVRLLTNLSSLLIHEGEIGVDADTKKVVAWVNSAKSDIKNIFSIYADKCRQGSFFIGKTDTMIKSYFKKKIAKLSDWYIPCDEAIKYGFIDGLLGTEQFPSLESVRQQLIAKTDNNIS